MLIEQSGEVVGEGRGLGQLPSRWCHWLRPYAASAKPLAERVPLIERPAGETPAVRRVPLAARPPVPPLAGSAASSSYPAVGATGCGRMQPVRGRWPHALSLCALLLCAMLSAKDEPAGETIQLFNGKDFTNFYTFLKTSGVNNDPKQIFTIKDGVIRVSGEEFGYFATTQEYENYHLKCEFKWGVETSGVRKDKARDSGILYHFVGPDKVWPKSLELQIIEGGTGDILLVDGASMDVTELLRPRFDGAKLSPDGRRVIGGRINWWGRAPDWQDVVDFRGPLDLEKKLGDWNKLDLIADGDKFVYYVNGVEVARGTGADPRKGKILFQSEGAELFFRNITLTPIKKKEVRSPLSAQDARANFQLDPGLKIGLVAAEPQLASPVFMSFDENGKLWVVEMLDYPNGPAQGQPPEGRIKILEDRDGDGYFEHTSIFADQLLFANALLHWKDGVIVTAAPHIVWLRDTDGDGKADKREILYEGFAAENPQLRVSHPTLGIDNWIYVANGQRGGQIKPFGRDEKPVNISGMDFRFDPLNQRHEAITGMGQYGLSFDDFGERFVCTNRNHLVHTVMPNRYIARNPLLAPPPPSRDNQTLGGAARIFPLSANWTTSPLHAGTFSAACGVTVYRGDLLGEKYRGSVFTCDPTGNLVHQEVLRPDGATFSYHPPRDGVEFLASPDFWFRPTSLAHGPDGALYVVDMYRFSIEHPDYMPKDLKGKVDLHSGKDCGRIWRIAPEKGDKRAGRVELAKADTEKLVSLLEKENAWWRVTAQRLLLERQDKEALKPLRKLALKSKHATARAHAMWLIDALGGMDAELALALLNDVHPRVRENGLRIAERFLADDAAMQSRVIALADDADAHLRFQVALSLGEWNDDRILEPLARIALAGAADPWTRTAVGSAVPQRAEALLALIARQIAQQSEKLSAERLQLLRELAALPGGRRDSAAVAGLLDGLYALQGSHAAQIQMACLLGLADGMGRRGTNLTEFLNTLPEPKRQRASKTVELLAQAGAFAPDAKRPIAERLDAVRLLSHAPWETAQPVLTKLLNDDPLQELRLAAVAALSSHKAPAVAEVFVQAWKRYTPAVRREVTEAMLRDNGRITVLLNEVEAGRVLPADLGANAAKQLTNNGNAEIKAKAAKLLAAATPAERKQAIEKYTPALALNGDPRKGSEIFKKSCATCHRISGVGVTVGPDISDTHAKAPEALMLDILDPNRAIDNNYMSYTVKTKAGAVLTGFIAAETASSVTLRRAEAQEDVVLRADIDKLQSTGQSLMPEGLEQNITVNEMADLLAYLKNWRYLNDGAPIAAPGK